MNAVRRVSAIGAAAVMAAVAAHAVEPRDIDAIFAAWDKPGSPGCALAVVQDGRIVYERGYGSADLEHEVPITPSTAFYVGSCSKQFTAFAIALLAQRGVIGLDDPVRKYVPELPTFADPITIRQLVHHTSGLRDYLELRAIAGEAPDGVFGDAEVLDLLARQRALNFAPGAEHLYSNSGYFLLGVIVKRASGKSLRDFAAENIFRPLGMTTAQFRDDHTALIPQRAYGYAPRAGGGFRADNPNFDVVGAGGLFMTVRDFLPWEENFRDAKVGTAETIALMQTPGKLNDGSVLAYAFGLTVGKFRGLDIVEHGGAYGGFRAHLLRFPQQRFAVACFCNLATMQPGVLARRVAELFLADAMQPARAAATTGNAAPKSAATPAKRAAVSVPPEKLRDYEGEFFSEELSTTRRIALDGGKLTMRGVRGGTVALVPAGADAFEAGTLKFAFVRDADGRVSAFALDAGRVRNLRFAKR